MKRFDPIVTPKWLLLKNITAYSIPEYGFSQSRIFLYKDRIFDSALIRIKSQYSCPEEAFAQQNPLGKNS